ncbi:MAG: MFS transporter, partial [Trueperaceae bacterium]
GVEARQAALIVSVTVLGIALASPVIGVLADRFGRRRILVTGAALLTVASGAATVAPTFEALVAARLVLGLLLPTLFAAGVALVSELLPDRVMRTVAGIYVGSTIVGGIVGRLLGGVLVDVASWRMAFGVSAALYLAIALMWWRVRSDEQPQGGRSLATVLRGTLSHLTDRTLVGGLLVGFSLFFAFQSTFSYLPFRLQAPPYHLSSTAVALTYLTYLAGVLSSTAGGVLARRTSLRFGLVTGFALAVAGNLVALLGQLPLLLFGLVVLCLGNWLVQGLAVGYVATAAQHDRAGANALYLMCYYLGGSLGAYLPGHLFPRFGFPGVIAASIAALLVGVVASLLLVEGKQGRPAPRPSA